MKGLKVNQLVDIIIDSGGTYSYYSVRIQDMDEDYIYLDIPMQKGQLVRFKAGQEIQCMCKNESPFTGFVTNIAEVIIRPIPLLKLIKPDDLVPFQQKRQYVRLQVTLPVQFRIRDEIDALGEDQDIEEAPLYKGQTVNISAGGALFSTEKRLESGQDIIYEMKLPGREKFTFDAVTLRIYDKVDFKRKIIWIAIEYKNISDKERDRIFEYIFEKERELIKLGIKE